MIILTNLYHRIDETIIEHSDEFQKESLLNYLQEVSSQEDNKVLCQLIDTKLKTRNFDDLAGLLAKSSYLTFFGTCPYCGNSNLLAIPKTRVEEFGTDPYFCVLCGETNPQEKLAGGLKKVQVIYQLIAGCKDDATKDSFEDPVRSLTERVLLEQCVILLATSAEVFLKDNFCILSNIRFVRHGKSLFSRFYSEVKNDFVNMGKVRKAYKEYLEVNLNGELGEDTLSKMNLLMQKRNVIVHNLGIADRAFVNQSGIECELKSEIPISLGEIEEYIVTLQKVGNILNAIQSDEMNKYRFECWKLFCKECF